MASTNSGPKNSFNDVMIILIVLVIVLSILVIGLLIYLWKKGYFTKTVETGDLTAKKQELEEQKEGEVEEKSDIERMKNEELGSLEEVAVIRVLEKKEGTLQKDLPEITNLSKATISRIIKRLEEKGKIERRPYKRTNMIFLKKKEEKD